jgi:hypothetical protein
MWCQNPENHNLKNTNCETLKTYINDNEVVLEGVEVAVSML